MYACYHLKCLPFAGGLLDQPHPWQAKIRRWLPYVVDEYLVRGLNARFSKDWEPTRWPVEKPADTEGRPASVREGLSHLKAFTRRVAALRKKPRR